MPWGAVIGAVGGIISGGMASDAASSNAEAARNAQQQTLQASQPFNLNMGDGSGVSFSGGNNAFGQLSPQQSQAQQSLYGGANQALGNYSNLQQTGGLNPLLMNALSSYLGSTPNANPQGQQQLANGLMSGNSAQGQLGGMFGNAAAGALGQLSGYNPQAAGSQYANLLAGQQAPANALAANNLGSNLFNSGNLGSTGGANQMAALQQSQGQQWLGDQVAGQQLGMQQQQNLAGQANSFGSGANSLFGSSFQQGANLNQNLYSNQQNQAQQGYSNVLNANTAGNQNLTTQANLGTGMLQGGMGIDQYIQSLMQSASGMGAARTGAAISGAQTNLQGQLGLNNTNAAVNTGMIGNLTSGLQNYGANNGWAWSGNGPSSGAVASAGQGYLDQNNG